MSAEARYSPCLGVQQVEAGFSYRLVMLLKGYHCPEMSIVVKRGKANDKEGSSD